MTYSERQRKCPCECQKSITLCYCVSPVYVCVGGDYGTSFKLRTQSWLLTGLHKQRKHISCHVQKHLTNKPTCSPKTLRALWVFQFKGCSPNVCVCVCVCLEECCRSSFPACLDRLCLQLGLWQNGYSDTIQHKTAKQMWTEAVVEQDKAQCRCTTWTSWADAWKTRLHAWKFAPLELHSHFCNTKDSKKTAEHIFYTKYCMWSVCMWSKQHSHKKYVLWVVTRLHR